MTLLVRNEEDVIRQNLEFHLRQGVDFFVITDNRSTDHTVEVISDYVTRGVAHLLFEDADTYEQAKWVTRMARMAAADFQADWVLNSDADEFWYGVGDTVAARLGRAPAGTSGLLVDRQQFVPPHPRFEGIPWWESMVFRQRVAVNYWGQPLPPKVCHRGHEGIEIGPGNHTAYVPADASFRMAKDPGLLGIAHFPLRSYDQFVASLECLSHVLTSRPPAPGATPGPARYWLCDKLKAGTLAEFYDGLIPELDEDGALRSGDLHLRDTRLRDMIRAASSAGSPGGGG